MADRLVPNGVFVLCSNDPPEESLLAALDEVFGKATAEVVRFDNPLRGREATNTVYLTKAASASE